MPQLQYLADGHAMAPQKVAAMQPAPPSAVVPSDAFPLCPPVPVSVLFNVEDGYAYQVALSHFASGTQIGVCVFSVRRVLLSDTGMLSFHMCAASKCAMPFCTVGGGVTWYDVVVGLTMVDPVLRASTYLWNVQVLGMDARSGGWLPITPFLSTPLEAHCFLHTNLEVLFEYYATDCLFMQATPLRVDAAAVDWQTPPDRSITLGQVPPPAPAKNYGDAPSRLCLGDVHHRCPTREQEAEAGLPPRRLMQDFDAACTPLPQEVGEKHDTEASVASAAAAAWSLVAFLQQQQRWGQRCRSLRCQLEGMSNGQALRLVQEVLLGHRPPQPRPCSTAEDKGSATWTLSLLEYECQLLSDSLQNGGATTEKADENTVLGGEESLRLISTRAVKVCQVVDAVWRTARGAREERAMLDDFPTGWLCLLLASLRLRCLRHVAFVNACVRTTANSDREKKAEETTASGTESFSSADIFTSKEELFHEAVQTAGVLLEALVSIGGTPTNARLPLASLSETLLSATLSIAELAAYLAIDTASRCVLLRAAVHVCRLRMDCTAPHGDINWLPRCVTDIAARMQEKLCGIPFASNAFAAYAGLTKLLCDSADYATDVNAKAETPLQHGSGGTPPLTTLGYTLLHVPTTAAVDAIFVRGNTAVREFRIAAAHTKATGSASPQPTHDSTEKKHK